MFSRLQNRYLKNIAPAISPHLRTLCIYLDFIMINARSFIFSIKLKCNSGIGRIISFNLLNIKTAWFFGVYLKTKMRGITPTNVILQSYMEIPNAVSQIRKLFRTNSRYVGYCWNSVRDFSYKKTRTRYI